MKQGIPFDDSLSEKLHELRQPLSFIRLACGAIKLKIQPRLAAQDAEYLDAKLAKIEAETTRAADLLEKLMHPPA